MPLILASCGARKEVKKLNDRTARKPVHPNELTKDKNRKAVESLICLSENRGEKKAELKKIEAQSGFSPQRSKLRDRKKPLS